jgi:hypothetical protein
MKRSYLILVLVTLSGCSSYSETFDCPAGKGVGCKSLSRVNQMVETGDLPHKDPEDNALSDVIKSRLVKTDQAAPLHLNADIMGAPVMYAGGPKTNRIWFAGYKDVHGNYHGPHFVEPVLKAQEG